MAYVAIADAQVSANAPVTSRLLGKLRGNARGRPELLPVSMLSYFELSYTATGSEYSIATAWTQVGTVKLWVPAHLIGPAGTTIDWRFLLEPSGDANITTLTVEARFVFESAVSTVATWTDTPAGGWASATVEASATKSGLSAGLAELDVELRLIGSSAFAGLNYIGRFHGNNGNGRIYQAGAL